MTDALVWSGPFGTSKVYDGDAERGDVSAVVHRECDRWLWRIIIRGSAADPEQAKRQAETVLAAARVGRMP